MTLHNALHLQADIDRLYFKRSEGGRELASVEVSVNSEINSLSRYVESCSGPLFEAVYKRERKERFQEKQLHGQVCRYTAEV